MYKDAKAWTPKDRFELMERENPVEKKDHFKGRYWHPGIEGPHCICGVLDCPSPVWCNCNEKAEEIAVQLIAKAIAYRERNE